MSPGGDGPRLAGLAISDPPERWRALGFAVGEDGRFGLAGVVVTLGIAPGGGGIAGWTLRGLIGEGTIDGLATWATPDTWPPGWVAATGALPADADRHTHGVTAVDHLVLVTPDLDCLASILQARGLGLSRRAEIRGRPMGFRRLGGPILEVVESPEVRATAFWGVTFAVASPAALEVLAAENRLVGEPRDAVQPGRRIATVSREAGLSTRVAFIDPEPTRDGL